MNCFKTLFLLSVGYHLNSCSQLPLPKYFYIDMKVNWTEAQRICRENYTDLATFTSMDDIDSLKPTFGYSLAWIGLNDDLQYWKFTMGNESNSWRWSSTGKTSKTGYSNWATNEPQNTGGSEACVGMTNHGQWLDAFCGHTYYFICYTATKESERTYVLIRISKSWKAAVDYCREHHTDLAMIDTAEQNNGANIARTDIVQIAWIGLYRELWAWSDKAQSSFKNWVFGQPDNVFGEFCAAENEQHKWKDESCRYTYPFICYKVPKLKKIVRVEFHTDADVSDPAVSNQIHQKLSAALADQGWTDVSLKWRIQLKKPAEDGAESEEAGGKPNGKGPPGRPNKN